MLPNLLFGLFLLALSGGLFAYHTRSRRAAESGDGHSRNLDFLRRQFRRRIQVCALLAVVGGALIGGIWMTEPIWSAGYWACVVALVIWIGVLAILDLMGSRTHLLLLRDEQAIEHAALKAEIAKYLAAKDEAPQVNGAQRDF